MRRIAALILGMAMSLQAHARSGDIPDQARRDRAGNDVNICAHRGKVVVVTFWRCGYCRRNCPSSKLQKVAGKDWVEVMPSTIRTTRRLGRSCKLKDLQLTMVRDGSGEVGKSRGRGALSSSSAGRADRLACRL
jgi:hypothetical protein